VEVLFKVDALRVSVDVLLVEVVLVRLGERTTPLWACRLLVEGDFPVARLSERRGGGAEVAVFDPDDAVCAIKEAGSLTGRVGDLGFGFTNPVCGGDA